jgi:hypothetical protein
MFKGGGWLYFDREVVDIYLGVRFIYYYDGYVFIIRLNMGLYVSEKVSFICLFKLYMWNRSSLFSDLPLFSLCSISNVWLVVPYACSVSSMC